jgi:ATP-dependent DNA helicase RecQ
VPGVGDKKLADYGPAFVERIAAYSTGNHLAMDVVPPAAVAAAPPPARPSGPGLPAVRAFPLFRQGLSLADVGRRLGRAPSTVRGYLVEFLRHEGRTDPAPWVDAETTRQIAAAAEQLGTDRMRPIFDSLAGQVSYEQLAIVIECLRNREKAVPGGDLTR